MLKLVKLYKINVDPKFLIRDILKVNLQISYFKSIGKSNIHLISVSSLWLKNNICRRRRGGGRINAKNRVYFNNSSIYFNISETISRIHLGLKQVSAEMGINCSTQAASTANETSLFSGQNTVVMVGTSIDT